MWVMKVIDLEKSIEECIATPLSPQVKVLSIGKVRRKRRESDLNANLKKVLPTPQTS